MATRGFSAQLLSLTLLLSLANVNPAFTQLEKVELTEILESALTSKESRIKKQNIEILAPRLAGATMYEYLIDKYAGTGLIELDSGRIVINKRIQFDNVFFHGLDLSKFKFNRRVTLNNCTVLEASNYQPWISFSDCRFEDLRLTNNVFRNFRISNSRLHGEVNLRGNHSSRMIFENNTFADKVVFRENRSTKGIDILGCTFLPTEGECLAVADSLTYERPLENNIQFDFYSHFEESENPVNLSIERCKFLSNSFSQKASIRSFNLSSLRIEDNHFQGSLDLNGSAIENRLIIRNNVFDNHVAFNDLIFPELFNIVYWDQFKGFKIAVYESLPGDQACNEFHYEVPSSVLYLGLTEKELTNRSGYEQLVNSYQSLFNIYKSRGDLELIPVNYVEQFGKKLDH